MARAGTNHKGGRPKGKLAKSTLDANASKARMVQLITARVDEIISWLFIKAREMQPDGTIKYDTMAMKELLDRGYGKAAQAVDVTTKGEQINTSSPVVIALAKEYEEKIKKGL